jgi:hypothetical protein
MEAFSPARAAATAVQAVLPDGAAGAGSTRALLGNALALLGAVAVGLY